jgi:pSer/pThr/pTyr-binding forkhead associated (FHA) protein
MNSYSFLIEEKGKNPSQIFLNPGDVYTFGRDKKCDYTISNNQVSRIQATLRCKNDEVVLVLDGDGDNVSRNGVYDRDGDKISVQKNLNPGEFVWIVMIEDFHVKLKFLENFDEESFFRY